MIRPAILGRGNAGRALRRALSMFSGEVAPAEWLERGEALPPPRDPDRDLLVIANPHALHAPRLLEAAERGYRWVICEKPAAVDREQVTSLRDLPIRTWICHGYRLLWGPRRLRRALADGRFGSVVSIEGRYWQSSAAAVRDAADSWKNDPALAGRHDVLLDLATHWADLVVYLVGRPPEAARLRRWWVNSAAAHRDTHVHLELDFGSIASFGSVSKTFHGAGNELELFVLGEKASAKWSFAEPDLVEWGQGAGRSTEARGKEESTLLPPPFHGLGWMEGYARLVEEVVAEISQKRPARAPTLAEHLEVVRHLLEAAESP